MINKTVSSASLCSIGFLILLLSPMSAPAGPEFTTASVRESPAAEASTLFQTAAYPKPEYDIRSDAAVVYGVDDSFTSRVAAWRDLGYRIEMMTGVA